jgi:hypothetical protein
LSKALSDWYFSEAGGLLLTKPVREFYFALQDLLREITKGAVEWTADRPSEDPKDWFDSILRRDGCTDALRTLETLDNVDIREWPSVSPDLAKDWRKDIAKLAEHWQSFSSQHFYL